MDKVQEIMTLLDCSEEQAQQVIISDQEVDKMGVKECESDLSQEQKATSKKYRQGDRKPMVLNLTQRERKADTTKRDLISLLAETLQQCDSIGSVEITNAERQIDFLHNDRKLRIVLSAPRS